MNKTQFQEGRKSMAEFKICRNETLGEISLLGKPANKSRSAKIVSLVMNVQQSLQNTLKKKC